MVNENSKTIRRQMVVRRLFENKDPKFLLCSGAKNELLKQVGFEECDWPSFSGRLWALAGEWGKIMARHYVDESEHKRNRAVSTMTTFLREAIGLSAGYPISADEADTVTLSPSFGDEPGDAELIEVLIQLRKKVLASTADVVDCYLLETKLGALALKDAGLEPWYGEVPVIKAFQFESDSSVLEAAW